MKIKAILDKIGNHHFIPIQKDIGEKILAKFGKRVLCEINGKNNLHCALRKTSTGTYAITIGKATKAKFQVNYGDQLSLEFKQDDSPFQFEMPEELEAVLDSDPEGNQAFKRISDGKKRSAIHLVNSAKRSETRINRALKIIENLKMGISDPKEFLK